MTPWTVAHQAPLSTEFSRQKYWGGVPLPPPWIFLTKGLNPDLLHRKQLLYHLSHQGSPCPGRSRHPLSCTHLPAGPSIQSRWQLTKDQVTLFPTSGPLHWLVHLPGMLTPGLCNWRLLPRLPDAAHLSPSSWPRRRSHRAWLFLPGTHQTPGIMFPLHLLICLLSTPLRAVGLPSWR